MKQAHRVVYDKFNATSMALLGKYGGKVPLFVTANLVTSARLGLVLPTTLLLSHGYTWAPASLVMINAVFDYVDGAVARWERNDSARAERISNAQPARPFGLQVSNKSQALTANWGAYYDALADKLFAIPVWVCIVVMNPTQLWIQLAASSHVLIEAVSVLARTKSFYLKPTASSTVVTAGYKGKLKQAISMLGTALVLLPEAQLVGGALLVASLPLSFASLQDKLPTKQARPRAWVLLHPTETDPIAVLAGIARKRDQYDVYVCTTTSRETEFWLGMGDFVCGVLQRAPTTPFTQDELVELGGGEVWVESPVTTTTLIPEAKPL